jgi:Cu(I)/Ag(I) efflux system membrane fusion protein
MRTFCSRQPFAALAFALLLWPLFFGCSRRDQAPDGIDYYTCPMHPAVHSQTPHEKCPFCSMDLVPVPLHPAPAPSTKALSEFEVPLHRQQLIGLTFASVARQSAETRIHVPGTVEVQQQLRRENVCRLNGYVHAIHVFASGDRVEKGQLVAELASAEFTVAQTEMLRWLDQPASAELAAARAKLREWDLSEEDMKAIESARAPKDFYRVLAPLDGTIENLALTPGQRVSPGTRFFEIVDLSAVWVWAELYEDDLAHLAHEAFVRIALPSSPGVLFTGKVAIFDHHIDEAKHTARLGISIDNPDTLLHPGMRVDVDVPLEHRTGLAIPASAVLPSGKSTVVFVDRGEGRLEPRVVELSEKFGDVYFVRKGLTEGERVVASANFLIDSEARLQGALKSW